MVSNDSSLIACTSFTKDFNSQEWMGLNHEPSHDPNCSWPRIYGANAGMKEEEEDKKHLRHFLLFNVGFAPNIFQGVPARKSVDPCAAKMISRSCVY